MEHQSSLSFRRWRCWWRLAGPILNTLGGGCFLVGCVYLPIPEHKVSPGPDFRDFLGPKDSNKPIRPGATSRAKVVELLGAPPYHSADGTTIEYCIRTEIGLVFWLPYLAFVRDQEGAYVAQLLFDENGVLKSWEMAHSTTPFGAFGLAMHPSPERDALSKLH